MLYYALLFLVLALVAAVFGFGGFAHTFAWIAQLLVVLFVALAVVAALSRALQGRMP